jgi:hypothetical protein
LQNVFDVPRVVQQEHTPQAPVAYTNYIATLVEELHQQVRRILQKARQQADKFQGRRARSNSCDLHTVVYDIGRRAMS